MRLRHKKPLNPYKGQTNNDKSEFNDDDFNQQGSPIKRVQMPLIQTAAGANDQVFKYARILTKFIKTANQNYRLFAAHDDLHPNQPLLHNKEQLPLNDSENQRENTPFKSQQFNQRKQKLKLQTKKQVKEPKRQQKIPPKKKELPPGQLTNQENKPKPLEHPPANSIEPSRMNSFSKSNIGNLDKMDKNGIIPKNEPPISSGIGMNPFTAQNGGMGMQNIKTDASVAASLNQNSMQNNLQAYLNYANFFGQNQLLPGMYAGMQGMQGMQGLPMQMNQLPMGMMPGYLPNMQMGMNMKLLGMGMNNPLLMQAQQQAKTPPSLFTEQAKIYSSNKQANQKNKNSKEVYPLKRAAFHVAIAYKIYLDKLKKEGVSFQNLEDIDPTRNARRVKSGQASVRGKQSAKKKKG